MSRDIGPQLEFRLVFKNKRRVEGCILFGLLLREGWPGLRPPALVCNIHTVQ
jgi:hypothetical protein